MSSTIEQAHVLRHWNLSLISFMFLTDRNKWETNDHSTIYFESATRSRLKTCFFNDRQDGLSLLGRHIHTYCTAREKYALWLLHVLKYSNTEWSEHQQPDCCCSLSSQQISWLFVFERKTKVSGIFCSTVNHVSGVWWIFDVIYIITAVKQSLE